eukprot:3815565-Pyramimonas_sp.AAC.1
MRRHLQQRCPHWQRRQGVRGCRGWCKRGAAVLEQWVRRGIFAGTDQNEPTPAQSRHESATGITSPEQDQED